MPPRRLTLTLAACLLLGFLINFLIAAILGARPDHSSAPMGFGFIEEDFTPSVNWAGDFGRERISIGSGRGLEGTTFAKLESRFRSIFGPPNGTMTPQQLAMWSSRLFPQWGAWPYHVTAAEGSRRMYAIGFPLRSFAGYDTDAQVSFTSSKPASGFHDTGFLWRDDRSPIRAVVYIPLLLGTFVNAAVYAIPCLAIAFFPSLRRSLRLRRGHCPLCNYDLRRDLVSGCPECGWNRTLASSTPANRE